MLTWAVGDYCISLKVLKSPHKEIYSFKLTMLWLSLSSSLSSAKYFHLCKYAHHNGGHVGTRRDNHSIVSLNEYISL